MLRNLWTGINDCNLRATYDVSSCSAKGKPAGVLRNDPPDPRRNLLYFCVSHIVFEYKWNFRLHRFIGSSLAYSRLYDAGRTQQAFAPRIPYEEGIVSVFGNGLLRRRSLSADLRMCDLIIQHDFSASVTSVAEICDSSVVTKVHSLALYQFRHNASDLCFSRIRNSPQCKSINVQWFGIIKVIRIIILIYLT